MTGSLKCLSPSCNPRRALCRLCFLRLSRRAALRGDGGMSPRRAAAGDSEPFFVCQVLMELPHEKTFSLVQLLPPVSSFLSVSL